MDPHDPVYLSTRRLILSPQNPYYFSGTAGQGIGGPHIGLGYIWPMSIAMQVNTFPLTRRRTSAKSGALHQALTSTNEKEKESCVQSLIASTASTGLIHESFWMNDANRYTRSWFAWANSLVGELLYQMAKESGCTIP